jgi:hypothetical protein
MECEEAVSRLAKKEEELERSKKDAQTAWDRYFSYLDMFLFHACTYMYVHEPGRSKKQNAQTA